MTRRPIRLGLPARESRQSSPVAADERALEPGVVDTG
ncbi:hypothetical protein SAMN04489729_8010 [Amycolatopsis lurida]|nr:hypothetical protein SAMN04489729_8010 [Amycolatopsis lurida]